MNNEQSIGNNWPTNQQISTVNMNNNGGGSGKKIAIVSSICIIAIVAIVGGMAIFFNQQARNEQQAKIDALTEEIERLSDRESEVFFETGFSDEYLEIADEKASKQLEKEILEEKL